MSTHNRKIKYHKRPGRYVDQAIRDAEAAAVGRSWLEPCESARLPKLCQCNKCGNVVKISPASVQRGYGCKPCKTRESNQKRAYSQEHWDDLAAQIDMKWVDEVEHNEGSYRIQCLNCEHVWVDRPVNLKYRVKMGKKQLKYGRAIPWCPECENKYRDENLSTLPDNLKHGARGYKRGCRCSVCTKAKAEQNKRYLAKKHNQSLK